MTQTLTNQPFTENKVIQSSFQHKRFGVCKISAKNYHRLFLKTVEEVMKEDNRSFNFSIDEYNKEFINQMFHYINYSDSYTGDLNKGVMLVGKIGCGKTFLMRTILKIIEITCCKFTYQVHAKDLIFEIEKHGMDVFRKRPMYIDDFGKEVKEAKIYGTSIRPIEDIIAFRDMYNSITFASGNYMESLEEFYSKHIMDRIYAMFNIHVLGGESRRNQGNK